MDASHVPVSERDSQRLLILFLSLLIVFSTVVYLSPPKRSPIPLDWCPGAAALIACLVVQRNLRDLGWSPGTGYLLPALLIPLGCMGLVYGIAWLGNSGSFDPVGATYLYPKWLYVVSLTAFYAFGEEIGWRGLLVPQLARRMSAAKAALWSGALWAVWHYPVFFKYDLGGPPLAYGMTMFTIMVVGSAFFLAWMRLRSGSVWPAVVFHSAHNLAVTWFDASTIPAPLTPYLVSETGIGLALAYPAAAFWLWRRAHRLS
ncbi:CPBP family intramembrane metalloprotease [Luteimonas gilva]|uniref:CPBP family intramembrane metalloprotease n=1 Tax=Luteimonas gilva TaxID=2572684 RepID=A0A4U5JYY9_9GAMM|nr:CPBP family intramembrane glutamic endopeptidase [Luteimonas gilva]TKR33961.1 CPBP family intramembrane metalloprotease [Luteimonas gilva]